LYKAKDGTDLIPCVFKSLNRAKRFTDFNYLKRTTGGGGKESGKLVSQKTKRSFNRDFPLFIEGLLFRIILQEKPSILSRVKTLRRISKLKPVAYSQL